MQHFNFYWDGIGRAFDTPPHEQGHWCPKLRYAMYATALENRTTSMQQFNFYWHGIGRAFDTSPREKGVTMSQTEIRNVCNST